MAKFINEIQALKDVVKAAWDFRISLNCYSTGVSVLSEDYIKEKDEKLQAAMDVLVKVRREMAVRPPIDPSRLPPSVSDMLAAAEIENEEYKND